MCRPPFGQGCRAWAEWVIGWPIKLLFVISIPDCREHKWSKWYPLTFAMCIVWIGTLSYVVNWMMTIIGNTFSQNLIFIRVFSRSNMWKKCILYESIGHTLRIPDSVMGLTFIAAGTSVPEIVSSLIVARQGTFQMEITRRILS